MNRKIGWKEARESLSRLSSVKTHERGGTGLESGLFISLTPQAQIKIIKIENA